MLFDLFLVAARRVRGPYTNTPEQQPVNILQFVIILKDSDCCFASVVKILCSDVWLGLRFALPVFSGWFES